MFGHLPELGLILVVALIVFGPDKLPEVARNVGRVVRDVRQALDTAINPEDTPVPDDFSAYYYESLARSGEPPNEDDLEPVPFAFNAEEYEARTSGAPPRDDDDGTIPDVVVGEDQGKTSA